MSIIKILKHIQKRAELLVFRARNIHKQSFVCPICQYKGPFADFDVPTGLRINAQCPNCWSLERARIQYVVMKNILATVNTKSLKMLHFSPESFFSNYFSSIFGQYDTADIIMDDVDFKVDIQDLPFSDESYDYVFASHVLEHVPDDDKALSEIRRILRPNGIAILPVPLVTEKTVEYPEPNPYETYHVRAPGYDYFDRYEKYFSRVDKFSSDSLPPEFQLYIYEDRSQWPTKECPLRMAMTGEKHVDIVPVCHV